MLQSFVEQTQLSPSLGRIVQPVILYLEMVLVPLHVIPFLSDISSLCKRDRICIQIKNVVHRRIAHLSFVNKNVCLVY